MNLETEPQVIPSQPLLLEDTQITTLPGSRENTKFRIPKPIRTLGNIVTTFAREMREQIAEGDTLAEKVALGSAVGGIALAAAGGQLADRFRVPESINIPYAIGIAEDHGKLEGALSLGAGIYVTQLAIGAAWGLGIKTFRKTAEVFDNAYPGYKEEVAEEGAGYFKTLFRQSVIGLGTGNTPFITAEALNNSDISAAEVIKSAEKTSHRLAISAAAIGYGAITLAYEHPDKNILFWSVPDVVSRLEKPSTWIILGVGLEVVPRILIKGVKAAQIAAKKLVNKES